MPWKGMPMCPCPYLSDGQSGEEKDLKCLSETHKLT